MLGISTELRAQVPYGVKLRAYISAAVSAADGLSDAYMIDEFSKMGNTGAANSLRAMVGANLAFQTLIVYGQNQGLKKDKWKTVLVETLTVITFVKPGVDAYRVASGAEQAPSAGFSPLKEMLFTKCSELFFEAIPG
jgi:hypothetical protein